MRVVEIFNSIEGEGKRAGLPSTFIRLHGCNLRCTYCDSMYAVEGTDYTEMSIEQIMKKAEEFGCPNITVTGGEPLIYPDIKDLLQALCRRGYWVNVETNGSIKPPFRASDDRLFYTIDYKTSSSGMMHKMDTKVFSERLANYDVLKFVVGCEQDLEESHALYNTLVYEPKVYVSPIFGKIEPKDIVDYILSHQLWDWRVQLQLHKFIWEPDMRGV